MKRHMTHGLMLTALSGCVGCGGQAHPTETAAADPMLSDPPGATPTGARRCGPPTTALIDDFEDGDSSTALGDGQWYLFNDGTAVQTPSEAAGLVVAGGYGKSHFAAHTSGQGFTDWGAGFGASLECAADVREFEGYRFAVKAAGARSFEAKLVTLATDPVEYGGECSEGCGDHYTLPLQLPDDAWYECGVRFDDLAQAGWGAPVPLDLEGAKGPELGFQLDDVPFDMWVDELRFATDIETTSCKRIPNKPTCGEELGLQGQWQLFGDSYGSDGAPPGVCQAAGHAEAECSIVTSPDPRVAGFPHAGGVMCATGSTAQVLPVGGLPDYPNMWGAGVALTLDDPAAGQPAAGFDASAHRVVGISFDIDVVPESGLRVLFPTPLDVTPVGPSYWGATESYPPSPVRPGTNIVLFDEVQSPEPSPRALDTTQLRQIAFLAPSNELERVSFDYCISNLQLLVQ